MAELTQGAFLPLNVQYRVRPDPVQNRLIKVEECSTAFNTKDSAKIFPSLVDLLSFQFLKWFIHQTSGKKFNILLDIEKCSHIMVGKHEEKCCAISLSFLFCRGNEFE